MKVRESYKELKQLVSELTAHNLRKRLLLHIWRQDGSMHENELRSKTKIVGVSADL